MTLFVLFGALALGAGVGMLFQRNAVHAALLLVVNLLSVAVLFLTLGGARMLESLPSTPSGFGTAQSIGTALFSTYLLPFEVTGLLLLVATIGILMLAKREPR